MILRSSIIGLKRWVITSETFGSMIQHLFQGRSILTSFPKLNV
jgi:hypothetical protein